MRKLFTGKNIAVIALAVFVAISAVGLVVKAQDRSVSVDKLIELAKATGGGEAFIAGVNALGDLGGIMVDTVLGGSGSNKISTYLSLDILTNGLTIDAQTYFTATTTPSTMSYFPINLAMDLTGTSTAKGATQNIIASWTNTGADKVLTSLYLDLSTQLGSYTASFQCGTSTWVGGVIGSSLSGTTTSAVLASSTVTTTYDTGDSWVFNDSYFATTSKMLLKTGDVVFCTRTIGGTMTGTATSADSFTSTGGATGVGRMLGNIWARGN